MNSEPSNGGRPARVPEWRNKVTFLVGTLVALVGFDVEGPGSPLGVLLIPILAAIVGGIQLLIVKACGFVLLWPPFRRWWTRSVWHAVTLLFIGFGCWFFRIWIDAELIEHLTNAGLGFLDYSGMVGWLAMLFVLCHWPRTSDTEDAKQGTQPADYLSIHQPRRRYPEELL